MTAAALGVVAALWAPLAAPQLAPPPVPPENPITAEKAVLGKILFWDEQLSSDNTVACGTCHQPAAGGAIPESIRTPGPDGLIGSGDDVFGSPGVPRTNAKNHYQPDPVFGFERQVGGRYPPTNLMAAYAPETFWDGRATSRFVDPQTGVELIPMGGALESQSVGPPLSTVEMSHPGRDWDIISAKLSISRPLALAIDLPADVKAALNGDPDYPELFRRAFGTSDIGAGRIAFALATYQRTLVPDQTPFDLGQLDAMQSFGLTVFNTAGRCLLCHAAPTFADHRFHNIGLRPSAEDPGRSAITGDPLDRGKFKTPSLRNVGVRNRYMHNGEFDDLLEVMRLYDIGGRGTDNQDPLMVPLGLTELELRAMTEFVEHGLTDPRVAAEQYPFDRPTLWIERKGRRPRLYGEESPGSGGVVPQMLARTPGNLGNVDFKLGLTHAVGGTYALLGVAAAADSQVVGGVPLNIDFATAPLLVVVRVKGRSGDPGAGYATLSGTVPSDPALAGVMVYAQWLVTDPGVGPGLAATRGARIPLF